MDLGAPGAARYVRVGKDHYTVTNNRGDSITFLRCIDPNEERERSAHQFLCEVCANPVTHERTTRPHTPRAIVRHANSHWMP